jgi:hypothetical protein
MPIPNAIANERFAAQLLAGTPARGVVAVAERLLAVQGQDMRGMRLALRARTAGLTAPDVDRAFTVDRSVVITWLNRGTLHVVGSEDYPWLHALTAPRLFTANARRLHQEGLTPPAAQRGVELIERSLAADGPLSRRELGERLGAAGIRVAGQALVHMLLLASLRGLIVRGPIVGGDHAFVLTHDWLGESKPVDRDRAVAELARRYLAGHGPATERDLAYWSGVPLSVTRTGFKSIAREIEDRGDGLFSLRRRARSKAAAPSGKLLGSFDPVLFGWTSREWVLGADAPRVVAGGHFWPFAVVRGRAAATWRLPDGKVELKPFRALSPADARSLQTDAADVGRFLGAS